MPPLVSVIIVNYNGSKYLKNCFDSLKNCNYKDFEIIFVDNGSVDNSVSLVQAAYPEVQVINNGRNLGLSIASNKGAEIAKGEYLFFLNNDTISQPNILTELVGAMEANPKIGVCACSNMTYDGSQEVSFGLSCDIFGFPCANEGPIFYADAGIFILKAAFDEIGGFDEKLFLYGEDRDLCWRVLLQGYDVIGVPQAVFYHDSACTFLGGQRYTTNVRKRYLGEYNIIRSMLKNYSSHTLLYLLPIYAILSFYEIIFLLFRGDFKPIVQAYLRAYWQNLCDFPDTWREHQRVQNMRKVSDTAIQKKMIKGSGKLYLLRKIGVPKFDNRSICKG